VRLVDSPSGGGRRRPVLDFGPLAATRASSAPLAEPDYGPTLPELLRRRFGMSTRATAAALALVVLAVGLVVLLRGGGNPVLRSGPPAFELSYAGPLHRAPARRGELGRLEGRAGQIYAEIVVRSLRLPPLGAQATNASLPLLAYRYANALRREVPGLQLRDEGSIHVGNAAAYRISFQTGGPPRILNGRDILVLPPDSTARLGIVLRYRQTGPSTPPGTAEQGLLNAAKQALGSLRFRTPGA
jgi:hypothetical protein